MCTSYKEIRPTEIYFSATSSNDGIDLAYKYDVLEERGNHKYPKKEERKGIRLVAVKLTNNSDTTINVARDLAFYGGENQIFPLEPKTIKNALQQQPILYILYMVFTPLKLEVAP